MYEDHEAPAIGRSVHGDVTVNLTINVFGGDSSIDFERAVTRAVESALSNVQAETAPVSSQRRRGFLY